MGDGYNLLRRCMMILTLSGTAFFHAEQAQGQTYAEQVWSQLQSAYNEVASAGGYDLINYIVGALADDESDLWEFPLEQGKEYLIFGVCDSDCSDLDITISDSSGTELESDVLVDDAPIVFFTPGKSAVYTIDVNMFACSVEPCYFGFGIFVEDGEAPDHLQPAPSLMRRK